MPQPQSPGALAAANGLMAGTNTGIDPAIRQCIIWLLQKTFETGMPCALGFNPDPHGLGRKLVTFFEGLGESGVLQEIENRHGFFIQVSNTALAGPVISIIPPMGDRELGFAPLDPDYDRIFSIAPAPPAALGAGPA